MKPLNLRLLGVLSFSALGSLLDANLPLAAIPLAAGGPCAGPYGPGECICYLSESPKGLLGYGPSVTVAEVCRNSRSGEVVRRTVANAPADEDSK